ncbi:MAG: hypothetical protein RL156_1683 [Bacteroidota bacterium]|jgi:hypothetical protein
MQKQLPALPVRLPVRWSATTDTEKQDNEGHKTWSAT